MNKVNVFVWLWKTAEGTSFLNFKDEEPGKGWVKIPLVTKVDSDVEINRVKKENQKLRSAAAEVLRISDRKHDAWDKLKALLAKCPDCGSDDYIQIDNEGDDVAPESTYFLCNDCGHASDPE